MGERDTRIVEVAGSNPVASTTIMTFSPRFTITPALSRDLERIAEAKALIENAPILPALERQLRREARARSVHASTHLEGNSLSAEQVQKVLAGGEVRAFEKDLLEVKNYAKVLDFIEEHYAKRGFKVEEATIREMNRIILEGIDDTSGGAFRRGMVLVQNTRTREIVFTPPNAAKVPVLVEDLVAWLGEEKEISPVLEAAVAHYELVRIHPFADGNGRASRALAVLVLYRRGYDIRRVFSVEDYADSHPEEYYGALRKTDKAEGDLTAFLVFFAQALAVELGKVKVRIQAMGFDKSLQQRLGQVFLNSRQMEALVYLQKQPYLARQTYQEKTRAPERTARRDLEEMVKAGLLVAEGKGPSARYTLAR